MLPLIRIAREYGKLATSTDASSLIDTVNALLPIAAKKPYNHVTYGNLDRAQRMQMAALRVLGVYEVPNFSKQTDNR